MFQHPNTVSGAPRDGASRLRARSPCRALVAAFVCMAASANQPAPKQEQMLVILPFEIVDNTPVPGGAERNSSMLEKLTDFVAQRIDAADLYRVVPMERVRAVVADARLGTDVHTCNLCEIDLAKEAGGDRVMVGWIYKMSTLVLTLHIEIKDVDTEETVLLKAYDFRGDNEYAWRRAAEYMVRDLKNLSTH
jgi:hypothetical protein